MKKFGAKNITALAVALALVTVGGVYATWSFSDGSSKEAEKTFNIAVASKTGSTDKGTYNVEKSTLIYRVDQYSSAIDALATDYSTEIYDSNGATYAYVQTGVSKDTTTDTVTVANYARKSSSTTSYAQITATTPSGTTVTSYQGADATTGWQTDTTNYSSYLSSTYTAALCTIAGSYLKITFTPDDKLTGSEAENGVQTTFQFAWNTGSGSPTITLDDDGVYSSSGSNTVDIYNLDTTVYTIYPAGSGQTRMWTWDNDNQYFYYKISGLELVQYLSINKIIIENSSAYEALIAAADTSFKLIVNEDSGTALTTPTISTAAQGTDPNQNNTVLTIADAGSEASYISKYICYIFNGSDPSSATLVDTATYSDTISSGSTTTVSITPSDLTGLDSGTYYVYVKAMSNDTDTYENSALSSSFVIITWNGTTVTKSSGPTAYNSILTP